MYSKDSTYCDDPLNTPCVPILKRDTLDSVMVTIGENGGNLTVNRLGSGITTELSLNSDTQNELKYSYYYTVAPASSGNTILLFDRRTCKINLSTVSQSQNNNDYRIDKTWFEEY